MDDELAGVPSFSTGATFFDAKGAGSIGREFDYDYTLASYRLELQDFIYAKARDHLVERLHYPPALAERSYDREFPIRGLVFDRRHGVLLKLSYANRSRSTRRLPKTFSRRPLAEIVSASVLVVVRRPALTTFPRSGVLLSWRLRSRTVRKVPYQPTNLPGQPELSANLHPPK